MKSNLVRLKKVFAAITLVIFSYGYSQMTIEGTVKSAEGFPEMGALISINGSKDGVYTDADGNYSIKVSPDLVSRGKFTITAESPNGNTARKIIKYKEGDTKKENFVLSAIALDEVVAVGYGTSKRKDLTGSISSLKPSQDEARMATSVDDLLQGKVSGVNVVTGGSTPGAAGSITIRGANSLTGSSQPLYVIDNVPQTSTGDVMGSASGDYESPQDPLAGINPNDIEDIQILKDASATAIYGSRGANGVILITTKKGKMGKMNVSIGSKFTIAQAYGLLDIMDLKDFAVYINKKHSNDPVFKIDGDKIKYLYTIRHKDTGIEEKVEKEVTNRNWQKEALRLGFSNEYNLNINGGGEKLRYNFSTSYKDVNGIVQNTGLKHGDMRLNLASDLSDKITMNLSLSGFLRSNNMMPGGNTVGRVSGALIPTALNAFPFVRPNSDPRATEEEDKINVFSWLTDFDDISDEYRISLATNASYKFSPSFRYVLRAGGNMNNLERQNWYGLKLYKGMQTNGFYSQARLQRNNYNIENLLFYKKNFGFVDVDAMAGITYDAYKWLNTGLSATDFPLFVLRTNGLHTANSVKIKNPIQRDYQLLSYLSRLNLLFFNGKYILTGTFRADGTSKFSKGNQWGYFPSFALAWNVKQEDFLKNSEWLSQLKLRAGYGVTGSQNINPYTSIFLYESGHGAAKPNGDILQGMQVVVNNPNLKWETTSSINTGLDFDLLDGRLSGSVDAYEKTTKDLLINITLPGSTSFNILPVNKGQVNNKGIEFSLNSEIIRSKDFSWSIGGNLAKNKTTIHNLGVPAGDFGTLKGVKAFMGSTAGDHFGIANIFIEGEAPGLFFGFKTDGIVQEKEVYNVGSTFSNSNTPGNLKVVDVNNDGIVDINDKTIIGDPNPDFTYGFRTNIKYKQIRLTASFTGVKGGDILNSNIRYRGLASQTIADNNLLKAPAFGAWTSKNKSNVYTSTDSQIPSGIIYDRYIEDGSYLRCSDITLGFTFPTSVTEKIGLSNIDLFASVKNAFTITKYSGYDPTARSFALDPLRRGLDLWSFPMQRAYIFGVNIMF